MNLVIVHAHCSHPGLPKFYKDYVIRFAPIRYDIVQLVLNDLVKENNWYGTHRLLLNEATVGVTVTKSNINWKEYLDIVANKLLDVYSAYNLSIINEEMQAAHPGPYSISFSQSSYSLDFDNENSKLLWLIRNG